jgi:beta-glucosidase
VSFPPAFVWGAAASAYQIEGAANADGRGRSVWDVMCRKKGAIWGGHTGDVACDHYHRDREDVALMKEIGLRAYRFSISWPRVIPEGTGAVNPRGLDFYDRAVNELVAAGITPYVTLFHWDFPQALYERGGWLNRDSAAWFADFANVVVGRLSDRVRHWMTINEPQVFLQHGHRLGIHAPGDTPPLGRVLRAGHNVLLAHGKAVQAIRANSKVKCQIGLAPVGVVKFPATEGTADIEAAHKATFAVSSEDLFNNTWWMDPVFFGAYPEDGRRAYGAAAPEVQPGDMSQINQPLDFLGLNIYFGEVVRAGADGKPQRVEHRAGEPHTTMDFPVTPEALYWGPRFLGERYRVPIYITENGMASRDWIALDGKVHDPQRIDFLRRYLVQLRRAMRDGADVRGYFHWSILDNFEWAAGYKERFGLIYVDYATQKRALKDSAWWYRRVTCSNGASLDESPGAVSDEAR